MPLQNRVTPTGEIVADPARGLFMGNRGILHDEKKRLGKARWRHANWVTCRLAFKDRRRAVMTLGRYTELFFLDEAVALAAGHRPCAECRREDYLRFLDCWETATGERPDAKALDRTLHALRVDGRRQRTFAAPLDTLPDGAFVRPDKESPPLLVWRGGLHPYSLSGYGAVARLSHHHIMEVLTPESTVAALRAGYEPVIHPSAG